jgi:mono/diheme cytochrome c family protein
MKKVSVFFILVIVLALSSAFKQTFNLKESIERGKSIYTAQCSSCHMMEGEGISGVFPALAKSPNLASKERLVKVILKGVRGPITVGDVTYNGEMTGFPLNDQEVSDLINFVRNSFGNKAPAVLPKEIQTALKTPVKNYQPY